MDHFEPKNVYFLQTPDSALDRLSGPDFFKKTKKRDFQETADRLLKNFRFTPSDLVVYGTDTILAPHFDRLKGTSEEARVLDHLKEFRSRVFNLFGPKIPALLLDQDALIAYDPYEQRKVPWRNLAGVSPAFADLMPISPKTGKAKHVSQGFRPLNLHLNLHLGEGQFLDSRFLAEEHVYRTVCNMLTLAPDKTGKPTLSEALPDLTPLERIRAVWEAMQGCLVMHREGFIHNDVKPENIFYDAQGSQLFDFEMAQRASAVRKDTYGTQMYCDGYFGFEEPVTPENCFAVDTFSFGVSLGVVWTGDLKLAVQGDLYEIIQKKIPSSPLKVLIEEMTLPKREDRISLKEAATRLGKLYDFVAVSV